MASDELKFNVNSTKIPMDLINGKRSPTKREVIRVVMLIFDLFGLVAPFTLKIKLLMQEI
jgi:hypothetical protein